MLLIVQTSMAANVRRHIIVCVDCSSSFQGNNNRGFRECLYFSFRDLLLEEFSKDNDKISLNESEEESCFFNPETDAMTLLMFSLPGNNRADIIDRYKKHYWVESPGFVYYFSKQFVFYAGDYYPQNGTDFRQFVNNDLKSLFGGNQIIKDFNSNSDNRSGFKRSPISLSHYVYPLALNVLKMSDYSSEYVMVVFTDYKSGMAEGDSGDLDRIKEIVGYREEPLLQFSTMVNDISKAFYRVEYFKARKGDLAINAFKVRPRIGKRTEDATLIVESDMNLKQCGWNSADYKTVAPILLRFEHTNNFVADSLLLSVYDDKGQQVSQNTLASKASSSSAMVTPDGKCINTDIGYQIPEMKLQLKGVTSESNFNKLIFRFSVLGKYRKDDIVMPLCYETTRTLLPNNIEFKDPFILTIIKMIIAFVLLLCIFAVLFWMILRGKRKKMSIQLGYAQYQEGSYQRVGRDGALLLPCSFVPEKVTEVTYQFEGHISNEEGFCIPWMVNYVFLKASLPSDSVPGLKVSIIGEKMSSGWTHAIVKNGKTFNFEVTVDFRECTPIIKQGDAIEVRVEIQSKFHPRFVLFGTNPFSDCLKSEVSSEMDFVQVDTSDPDYQRFMEHAHLMYGETELKIHHFIKSPFSHPNYWVGIDPGTNGSCVTIGNSDQSTAESPNMVRMTTKDESGNKKEVVDSVIVMGGSMGRPVTDDVTKWEPGKDFDYGLHAAARIGSYSSGGANIFRSIKKLLGYKKGGKDGRIKAKFGSTTLELTGLDLQYLLVKALTRKNMDEYLQHLNKDPELLSEKQKIFPDGNVTQNYFQRAVVAIPNNYQLPQILDMVQSVKMNGFQEVKFIYEPEGILFHYLKQTFNIHTGNAAENIIVFDMGGATINSTIFHVEYRKVGDQVHYFVSTLSRLGYAVGGDDIDYAILEFLMHFQHIASCFKNDQERYVFQDEYKTALVELAQDFKLKFIKMSKNMPAKGKGSKGYDVPNELSSRDNFISSYLEPIIKMKSATYSYNVGHFTEKEKAAYPESVEQGFCQQLMNNLVTSSFVVEYVYNKVEDAVLDMIDTRDVREASDIHKIIFSGRSMLFPAVREVVTKTLKNHGRNPKEFTLNADLKSPVADGACWFGIFGGKLVFVDNSRVTSSYGFRYTRPGQNDYQELICQNQVFEGIHRDSLTRMANIESRFEANAEQVNFYQVMGSLHNGKSIFDENNRHKVRFLAAVNLASGKATQESITVGADGKVLCDVEYQGKPRNRGPVSTDFDTRDITKENARSYLFSVSNAEKPAKTTGNFRPSATETSSPKPNNGDTNYFNNENRQGFRKF